MSATQVLEPTILPDGTKHFELTAAITPWEVAPGQVVDAWTYNGMVPGPQMSVEIGDRVEVEVINVASGGPNPPTPGRIKGRVALAIEVASQS